MCNLSFDICHDFEGLFNPCLDACFENCLFLSRRIHLLLQCLSLLHLRKPLSEDYYLCSSSDTVVLHLKFTCFCFQALYVGVLLQICEDCKCLFG